MFILIPAYRPDRRLVELVVDLHRQAPDMGVLVVDDGSGPAFRTLFDEVRASGAQVLTGPRNRGKGHALRVGLDHVRTQHPGQGVVTADADGQHTVPDILAVAHRVQTHGHVVLGVRSFTGSVPLRSRIGNVLTSQVFRLATGWNLGDTQTGLRGFPARDLAWVAATPGERYEFELAVLLALVRRGAEVEEITTQTVYEAGNATSHFRPLRDSVRVLTPLLAFSAASAVSFVVDYVGVLVLHALLGGLWVPVVGARVASGTLNYVLNRRVFRAEGSPVTRSATRYLGLALVLLCASYLGLRVTTGVGVPLWAAKVLVDSTLYVASFVVQRRFVFRVPTRAAQTVPHL